MKTLVNKLKSDVIINIVNGDDSWYKKYTDEMLEFVKKCNPRIIKYEKKNLCSISCFQYGFMDLYKKKIEEIWKNQLKEKYVWRDPEEIMNK